MADWKGTKNFDLKIILYLASCPTRATLLHKCLRLLWRGPPASKEGRPPTRRPRPPTKASKASPETAFLSSPMTRLREVVVATHVGPELLVPSAPPPGGLEVHGVSTSTTNTMDATTTTTRANYTFQSLWWKNIFSSSSSSRAPAKLGLTPALPPHLLSCKISTAVRCRSLQISVAYLAGIPLTFTVGCPPQFPPRTLSREAITLSSVTEAWTAHLSTGDRARGLKMGWSVGGEGRSRCMEAR